MRYLDIPYSVLNETLYEDMEIKVNLKTEIDSILEFLEEESITDYEITKDSSGYIKTFKMWTDNSAYKLIETSYGEKILVPVAK